MKHNENENDEIKKKNDTLKTNQTVHRNGTESDFSVSFRDRNGINFEILVSKSRRNEIVIYNVSFLEVSLFRIIFLSYMRTLFTYYMYISHRDITHIYHS